MIKVNNIFRSVLETTPDTVLIIDENNVVVYCNENIKYTFGYEPKDLIDRDMSILIPLELREGHKNGINRFLNSGVPKLIGKTVEIIGLHKNGNTFPIELSLSFWKEDGKIFFSSIIRDISESKRILKEKDDLNVILQDQKKEIEALFEELQASEEELRASNEELNSTSEKLKNLNESLEKEVVLRTNQVLTMNHDLINKNKVLNKLNIDLDNFLYTASHDLKSPISNLEGLIYLMKKEFGIQLNIKEENIIDLIELSVRKLNKTINDLTEITKVQKDLNVETEEISLKGVINDVLFDLERFIQDSNAIIHENIEIDKVLFNKSNLRSIIYNLLNNAIKYRDNKRQLLISIRAYKEKGNFIFYIEDNGIGLPQHQLPKMFSMFKRFHSHVEGTGIGLYIIKRIVENHGGSISVESEEGKGSKFKVTLPQ
ncbi:MAG: PAS domain-containing sensor histidine kinase [Bacteroidota bacterium]|nr:PAS domain-containing sensor histidine kinase [Bacteroidota bacterium]